MVKSAVAAVTLKVDKKFVCGIDVGGTKVHITDTLTTNLHRFATPEHPDMYSVLDKYFISVGVRPSRVVIAWAGPRDDETGDVFPTNFSWPTFSPQEAELRYPGTTFETSHDMVATAAGVLQSSSGDLHLLKDGKAKKNGPTIAVTISTGVGVCVAVWDNRFKQRIFFAGEAGHIGFMPYTNAERRHLEHLFTKYEHPSIELAISGSHGVGGWIAHSPELSSAPKLKAALARAGEADRPAGAVLLEFATQGDGASKKAAHDILDNMGKLVGNTLADYALAFKSTGGIYLTGSVSLGLAEYWAANTGFAKSFVRRGTPEHAPWLEDLLSNIPIYLVIDPNIAAAGALALAKQN
jgi:glucokinase